jgi:hypothetical protein
MRAHARHVRLSQLRGTTSAGRGTAAEFARVALDTSAIEHTGRF